MQTGSYLFQSVRFLSDIGGAMGLFMGASVLSCVELLQLLLEIVCFCLRRCCGKRTAKVRSAVTDKQPARRRPSKAKPVSVRSTYT